MEELNPSSAGITPPPVEGELKAEIHIPENYTLRCVDDYEVGINDGCSDWPRLKFWTDTGAEWVLYGDSVGDYTPAQWRLLMVSTCDMVFGDGYDYHESHEHTDVVGIERKNGRLVFASGGGRCGTVRWSLPADQCRGAIEHVAAALEAHMASQATETVYE